MTHLIIASVLFFAIHSLVAGTGLRYWLIDKIGRGGYMGLFSLASLGSIVWMAMSYNLVQANEFRHLWDFYPFIDWITIVLMLPVIILAVVGLTAKNPMAAEQGKLLADGDSATGMMRISRHPFLNAAGLWAILHLLSNGDMGSLVFFGTFVLVVAFGMRSIDNKRAKEQGAAWDAFAAKTSRLPFVAIAQGRNTLNIGEIGAVRPIAGVFIYALLYVFHGAIFGVSIAAF